LTILNVPHPALSARSVLRGNWRQALRSWYVYFFQLPWVPEWVLSRKHFGTLRRAMRASANPGTFTDEDLDQYCRAWREPGALSAMLGWYRAFVRRAAARPWALRRPAPYPMPAQLIWGERERALEPSLAQESANLMNNGRLIRLPQATHWVHEDEPAVVTGYLLDLMRKGG
jgi:pimeloyl-ACP methyl ester carboxylesterase